MKDDSVLSGGVDVGTGAVKAAVCRSSVGGEEVLATHVERIHRRDPAAVAQTAWDRALERAGVPLEGWRDQVVYVASTGEGESIPFCDGHFYGMTTHARGARFLDPESRAVVDLGALYTRVFAVDDKSRVLRHRMTSQCASGTGQFLENIARYLGVRLDEVGPLSAAAPRAESCSSICAVLAETDVINMVSRGVPTGELLRGVAAESPVLLSGGLARDIGLKAAIERRLAEEGSLLELRAAPLSMYAGAIGAGLWAAVRWRRLRSERGAGEPAGAAAAPA
jgi:benzoyl-CoA reductase subunit D